jgi:hypothetical protein
MHELTSIRPQKKNCAAGINIASAETPTFEEFVRALAEALDMTESATSKVCHFFSLLLEFMRVLAEALGNDRVRKQKQGGKNKKSVNSISLCSRLLSNVCGNAICLESVALTLSLS